MTDAVPIGAYIDRVDRPLPGLYAIGLSRPQQREVLLVAAGPPRRKSAWALVDARPRGAPADAEVRALRERVEGGRVTSMLDDHGLVLRVTRGPHELWVTADARDGLVVAEAVEGALPSGEPIDAHAIALARARGETFVEAHERCLSEDAREAARAVLTKARAKLARRIAAIRGDQRAVAAATEKAEHARLFVASAARAPRGATQLQALDYTSGSAAPVSFALSPETSARAQLDAIFARAKRLRAGQRVGDARLGEAELALIALDEAELALARAGSADEVRATLERAARVLPADVVGRAQHQAIVVRGRQVALPTGVRGFVGASGAVILVGRDAASNDALTTKLSKPGDLWLHARDATGAHVVVPRWYRSGGLDAETLVDAATLAAHFSDARGEAVVDVSYTDRRFVKKSRGAPAGSVTLLEEKVLSLRIEPDRVSRLLRRG